MHQTSRTTLCVRFVSSTPLTCPFRGLLYIFTLHRWCLNSRCELSALFIALINSHSETKTDLCYCVLAFPQSVCYSWPRWTTVVLYGYHFLSAADSVHAVGTGETVRRFWTRVSQGKDAVLKIAQKKAESSEPIKRALLRRLALPAAGAGTAAGNLINEAVCDEPGFQSEFPSPLCV